LLSRFPIQYLWQAQRVYCLFGIDGIIHLSFYVVSPKNIESIFVINILKALLTHQPFRCFGR